MSTGYTCNHIQLWQIRVQVMAIAHHHGSFLHQSLCNEWRRRCGSGQGHSGHTWEMQLVATYPASPLPTCENHAVSNITNVAHQANGCSPPTRKQQGNLQTLNPDLHSPNFHNLHSPPTPPRHASKQHPKGCSLYMLSLSALPTATM
jgi:hypothetical protein